MLSRGGEPSHVPGCAPPLGRTPDPRFYIYVCYHTHNQRKKNKPHLQGAYTPRESHRLDQNGKGNLQRGGVTLGEKRSLCSKHTNTSTHSATLLHTSTLKNNCPDIQLLRFQQEKRNSQAQRHKLIIPAIREVDAGELQIQGQPGQLSEPCLRIKVKKGRAAAQLVDTPTVTTELCSASTGRQK